MEMNQENELLSSNVDELINRINSNSNLSSIECIFISLTFCIFIPKQENSSKNRNFPALFRKKSGVLRTPCFNTTYCTPTAEKSQYIVDNNCP